MRYINPHFTYLLTYMANYVAIIFICDLAFSYALATYYTKQVIIVGHLTICIAFCGVTAN